MREAKWYRALTLLLNGAGQQLSPQQQSRIFAGIRDEIEDTCHDLDGYVAGFAGYEDFGTEHRLDSEERFDPNKMAAERFLIPADDWMSVFFEPRVEPKGGALQRAYRARRSESKDSPNNK